MPTELPAQSVHAEAVNHAGLHGNAGENRSLVDMSKLIEHLHPPVTKSPEQGAAAQQILADFGIVGHSQDLNHVASPVNESARDVYTTHQDKSTHPNDGTQTKPEGAQDGSDGGEKAKGTERGDQSNQSAEKETASPDGTKIRTGPDGVRTEDQDGRTEVTTPDGKKTISYPTEVQNKDGTVDKKYPYDDRTETTGFPKDDPRSKQTVWPDGHSETEFHDGHKERKFAANDPDKRESEIVSNNGNTTTTKYRDGHTEQTDNSNGDVTKSYPPKNGKPGYNVTIHKDQATGKTSTKTGPYEEIKTVKVEDD